MRLSVLLGALALVACNPSWKSDAQTMAARDLADPASAQFRELAKIGTRDCVAGELNAKNQMGGYTGFRPFIVDRKKNETALMPDDGEGLDKTLAKARFEIFKVDCGVAE